MAKPNARSGNPPHSRRAGCELPYGAIPSHAAPAQRIPTSCLSYSMVSIPNPRSNSHCSSTSLAASPEALGSRWHYATRDQEMLRIADELKTRHHTTRSRRTRLPRNESHPATYHTAGSAFQTSAQTYTAHLLPLLPAPRPGEVDGTIQREIRKSCA